MNRPLTPSLSPSDGERVAEGRVRGGSWSQCMRKNERGLSMNCPSPGLRPPSPRLAGRGQGEGCQAGSWSQYMRKNERGLSMNRLPVAASRQSAAGCCSHELRRSAETPLRQGSWLQCVGGRDATRTGRLEACATCLKSMSRM